MKNEETKKATVLALDVMIKHADKGPSGFWTEDYEGCGNPKIFPEFREGLKRGRLVQKEHYLCPWNTAVLYGKDHGNIQNGCYYSCSIYKAKYLSTKMLKKVLTRFKMRLQNGDYDDFAQLTPLLIPDEIDYIEKQIRMEKVAQKAQRKKKQMERLEKAAALIEKFPDKEDLFCQYYGEKSIVSTYDGAIDFDPEGYRNIIGAEKFTYDEYLEVQINSFQKIRGWFAACYYHIPLGFKGCIEKITKMNICFRQIEVNGMYPDGSCFVGRENHVWMGQAGFESFHVGDCLEFSAEVYRYVKTGNGKLIDYSLRNPTEIKRITAYELPSDDDLIRQEVDQLICETCFLSEQCNRVLCIRNSEERQKLQKQLFETIKKERKP